MDSRAASSGGWLRPALPAVLGLVGLAAAARWGGLPSPPPIDLLLRDGMPLAILALAMALVRIGGLVDLSVGGIAMAAAAGLALLPAHWGVGPLPAAAAMVAGGALLGAVNGLLVDATRAPSWLVTGLMLALLSTAPPLLIGAVGGAPLGQAATDLPTWATPAVTFWAITGQPRWPALPLAFWCWLLLLPCCHWLVWRTALGNHVLAHGSDPQRGRALGMPIAATRLALFAVGGGLAGLGGVLLTTAAPPRQAPTALLLTAAVVLAAAIGGAFGRDRRQALFGSSLAALFIAALRPLPDGTPSAALVIGLVPPILLLLLWRRPPRRLGAPAR